jgi:uncharacterized protein
MPHSAEAEALLTVRVAPNARRSELTGWTADEKGRPVLLIKLAAPASDGKANEELIRFLAETCQCAKSLIELRRGATSRLKMIALPDAAFCFLRASR